MAVGRYNDEVIEQMSFYGGLAGDRKIGIKNSFADAECMDVRKSPSQMSVLPEGREVATGAPSVLSGLPVSMAQIPDGKRFVLDDFGNLYMLSTTDAISKIHNSGNTTTHRVAGLYYNSIQDTLFWPHSLAIKSIRNPSSSTTVVTFDGSKDDGRTMDHLLDTDYSGRLIGGGIERWSFKNGSSGTYSVPTSLSEAEADTCRFIPSITPMYRFQLLVRAKPASGNLKITIHDQQNHTIAEGTISAASITVDSLLDIYLPAPVETLVYPWNGDDALLHLHVTGSAAGFTVDTYESGKLEGLHFTMWARPLLATRANLYPTMEWQDGFLIANKQYVAQYQPDGLDTPDNASFKRHALKVIDNYEVIGLTTNDEYAVAACARVCTDETRSYKEGALVFWDGTTEGFNFFVACPQGEPEGIFTYNNITYCFIDGCLYAYTGGKELIKVRTIRETQSEFTRTDDSTHVYPYTAAIRRGIMLAAYPSKTTLSSLRFGILSWGCLDKNYPNSLAYSYKLDHSVDSYNSTNHKLEIGCVYSFGDTMYYGWKSTDTVENVTTTTNHLYKVDNSSNPASTFSFESLAFDNSQPRKEKEALRVCIAMKALPEGCTIRPKWKIDGGEWEYGTATAGEGDKIITADISGAMGRRFYDIQFGFDGVNDGNTVPPDIYSVSLDFRSLSEERKQA